MNVRPLVTADEPHLSALVGDRPGLALGTSAHVGSRSNGADLVVEERGTVVAHGFYRRLYGPTAELAVVAVGDHRLDVATVLVRALAAQARDEGISRLVLELPATDDEGLAAMRSAGRTHELVEGDMDMIQVQLLVAP
jgi:N-acetylglutamate synthase-like GNAT family acetyltransferase